MFILLNTYSQLIGQQVLFEPYSVQEQKAINNLPSEASLYRLTSWPDISKELHSLTLHLGNKYQWEFELSSIDLLAENHTLWSTYGTKHRLPVQLDKPQFYLGTIKDQPESQVTLMIVGQQIEASIVADETKLYIERLDKFQKGEKGLVVYDVNLQDKEQSMKCSHPKAENIIDGLNQEFKSTGSCVQLDLAIALDYTYLLEHSSSVEQAVYQSMNAILMTTNDYAGQFAKDVSFRIVEHVVSTCENCDPWTTNADAEVLLDDFTNWAQAGGFTQSHDLGQLWTGRDLHKDQSFSTVGFAHSNGVCGPEKYHILEDINLRNWQRRVLCSHEIGHNLNSSHDAIGSQTIMAPFLTNSTEWSANSINRINAILNGPNCFSTCMTSCESLSSFALDDFDENNLNFSWASEPNQEVNIKLENQNFHTIILDTIVQGNSYQHQYNFAPCTNLKLEISALCNPDYTLTKLLNTDDTNQILIKGITTSNCQLGNYSNYDLEIAIYHTLSEATVLFIEVDELLFTRVIDQSAKTIQLEGLISTSKEEKELVIYQTFNGMPACGSMARFTTPSITCDLYYRENFNACVMPKNWTKLSTNEDYFAYPYEWSVGDSTRKIENYARQSNAFTPLTLDGSCMAYFDDDINSNTGYTGVIELFSPVFNVSEFQNVRLSFDYLFHDFSDGKGSNNSEFKCEIWNGSSWTLLLVDNSTECPWSDVWASECGQHITLPVDQYRNNQFQVKFSYTDGNSGDWTGMVALDNFLLTGTNPVIRGCTDPNAINYNPSAQVGDNSCYSCHNNILDGTETEVDCGGFDCVPCPQECLQDKIIVNRVQAHTEYSGAKTIEASGLVDVDGVTFIPGETMILAPSFEVVLGKTLSVQIIVCAQ